MTRVKICGLTRQEDAELALSLGADELGFVFEPTSPRCIQSVPAWLDSHVNAFAVFGPLPSPLPETAFLHIQYLPDWNKPLPFFEGRKARPVLRPQTDTDWGLVKARLQEASISELVLDPFHPEAYGGTGKKLDDSAIEKAQETLEVKLVIAGGLTPQNAAETAARHHPYGLDVSSGIESAPGIKDHEKLREFLVQAGKTVS